MAEERHFTEGETYALVADRVTQQTASLTAEKQELTERLTAAETDRDAALARATAAEELAATTKTAHDEFVAGIEAQKAQEATRTERLAAVVEVAPKLEVSAERADRIVAMDAETFADYVETLRETAALIPVVEGEPKPAGGAVPRESAAFVGAPAGDSKAKGSVLAVVGARRALGQ